MLLSAVSVLVVAQSSSELPGGLMNNPVLIISTLNSDAQHKLQAALQNKRIQLGASQLKFSPLYMSVGTVQWL